MNFYLYVPRMPRKLSLSVHRKNQFRTKRDLKYSVHPYLPLPVSIPLKSYFSTSATSIVSLQKRINEAAVLPHGI